MASRVPAADADPFELGRSLPRMPHDRLMATVPATCSKCHSPWAAVSLDGQLLCDRCADRRLAAVTGWPELPAPPPAEVITGPDGRRHTILYRIMRWPGATSASAEELGVGRGAGYRLSLSIDHGDDPSPLLVRLRRAVRWAIAHPYMEPDEWYGWGLVADEAGGWLCEDDRSDLPRVVIDGHSIDWEAFGHLLASYVGWSFQLRLGVEPPSGDGGAKLARARPASAAELDGKAADMIQFVIDSAHYPSRD